jgi:predicted DNA-binding mobile mystery protein A
MDIKQTKIRQLDNELSSVPFTTIQPPKAGWVRTIRKALGMTIKQLAKRLGVDPSRVVRIEMDEAPGSLTLRSLKGAADALNCRLVYAFVPKNGSFKALIEEQARQVARTHITTVNHSMQLESQGLDIKALKAQEKSATNALLQGSWKYLWRDDEV